MSGERLPERLEAGVNRRQFLQAVTAGVAASAVDVSKLFSDEPAVAPRPKSTVPVDAEKIEVKKEEVDPATLPPLDFSKAEDGIIPLTRKQFIIVKMKDGKERRVDLQYSKDGRTLTINGVEVSMRTSPSFLLRNLMVEVQYVEKKGPFRIIYGSAAGNTGHSFMIPEEVLPEVLEKLENGDKEVHTYPVYGGDFNKDAKPEDKISTGSLVRKVKQVETLEEFELLIDDPDKDKE